MNLEVASHILSIAVVAGGVVLAAQWLYNAPKTRRLVEDIMGRKEREICAKMVREAGRIDQRHDECRMDMKESMDKISQSIERSLDHITKQVDFLYKNEIEKKRDG